MMFGRKTLFFDELYMHNADSLVMCFGDFNECIGRLIGGFDGGYGVGQRNLEGKML